MIRVLSLALALVLVAAPAHADPLTALFAGLKAFAATTFGGFIVNAVAGYALSALSMALAGKPDAPNQGIKTTVTLTGGTNPESFVLGRYATGGVLACPPLAHQVGGLPNDHLTFVIELGCLPVSGLSRLFVNGEPVTIGAGVHSDYGSEIEGEFQDHLWLKFYDGTQTVADPMLLEKYGSDPDYPWTADMVGYNRPYAILTVKHNTDLWTGLPQFRFEIDGIALYDFRKDDTAGGAGAHRWEDPSTWEPTYSPVVMADNILRGISLPSGDIWGGRADNLPVAVWAAAMNECDVPIELAEGGTEPQFRSGLEVTVDEEPAAIIEKLLATCSGAMVDVGGAWHIRVGPPSLPVYYLTDEDIIIDVADDLDPWPSLSETVNGVRATFPNPEAVWEMSDAPAYYRSDLEALDRNRRLAVDLPLVACPYEIQVQRLTRAYVEDERRFIRHSLQLPPDAAFLNPLESISWSSARNGYSAKVFELSRKATDIRSHQSLVAMRERDPGDYSWSKDFQLPTEYPPINRTPPQPVTLPGIGVAPYVIEDANGVGRRPGILLTWSQLSADGVQWQVRLAATEFAVSQGFTSAVEEGRLEISEGLLGDTDYQLRALVNLTGAADWTGWLDVRTPDIGFSVLDLGDDVWDAIAEGATSIASGIMVNFQADIVTPISQSLDATIVDLHEGLDLVDLQFEELDSDLGSFSADLTRFDSALQTVADITSQALVQLSETTSLVYGAGIRVDEETGQVYIEAYRQQEAELVDLSIRLDAAEGTLTNTATMAMVNNAIAGAQLDPTELAALNDLQLQVNTVETELDAVSATLTSKAEVVFVDGLNVRLATAEDEIDGLEAQITTKVEVADFNGAVDRITSAEENLSALDIPTITHSVSEVRRIGDEVQVTADMTIAEIIDAYEGREEISVQLASAEAQLQAGIDEEGEARASDKLTLEALIGATDAALVAEQQARVTGDSALAGDITDLAVRIGANETGLTGAATARQVLEGRIEANEGSIEAHAVSLTQLQTELDTAEGDIASQGVAIASLDVRTTANENEITTHGAAITSLQGGLTGANADIAANALAHTALEARVTSNETELSSQASEITQLQSDVSSAQGDANANALAISSLETRTTAAEGTITSQGVAITQVQADLAANDTDIAANAGAISSLDTRVTSAEGDITAQGLAITQVQADIAAAQGDADANALAITSLSADVSANDGKISVHTAALLSLNSTVGDNTATITEHTASIDGMMLEKVIQLNNNGHISGMVLRSEMDDAGAVVSEAAFIADKFAIVGPDNTPMNPLVVYTTPQVVNGETIPPGTYFVGRVTTQQLEVTDTLSATFATIGTFSSAASGERVEISDDKIAVYDANGVVRVKIGDLS